MPTLLEEYIGSLVSSIADARLMSDAQTARIAADYAKHPLLKHFSVPRMRIDDVEMEINVALDKIAEDSQTKVDPIDNAKVNTLVYKEIVAGLGRKSLPLAASRTLKAEIARRTQTLESEINIKANLTPLKDFINRISEESLTISRGIGLKSITATTESLSSRLEKSIAPAISLTEVKQRKLRVMAESKELSEQKPECFIKVKLKISERGLEWSKGFDSAGNEIDTLIPE